ncbi:MAG: 50S ribosomal protein L6 [Spirochaetes bacterium]|nr:50S ribosomal protein L6 [Spirochaetota bacterium]
MSRIGKKIIEIPEGVEIQLSNRELHVKGGLGAESISLLDGIDCKIEDKVLTVLKTGDETDKKLSAYHGLFRSLISNIVEGVSKGFKKELEIVGVGYRAAQQNKNVEIFVGYSHSITFQPPEGIEVKVLEPTKLEVFGVNKQQVGQVAANIRKLRPPEPYKGKGIRYKDEYIKRKAGKAGKA